MTTGLQTLKAATEATPGGLENLCIPTPQLCNCRNKQHSSHFKMIIYQAKEIGFD